LPKSAEVCIWRLSPPLCAKCPHWTTPSPPEW